MEKEKDRANDDADGLVVGNDDDEEASTSGVFERRLDVVESTKVETQPNRSLARTASAGGIIFLLGLLSAALSLPVAITAVAMGLGLILIRAGMGERRRRTKKTIVGNARVRVSKAGIERENAPRIPADAIAQAYFEPNPFGGDYVRCLDAQGRIVFEAAVDNEKDGILLLRALGRDPTQRRANFKVMSLTNASAVRRIASMLAMISLAMIGAVVPSSGLGVPVMLIGAALPLLLLAIPTRLEVGLDGVLVRWMGTRRFVPYDKIHSVTAAGHNDLRIVLKDGTKIPIAVQPTRPDEKNAHRDAIITRIEECRKAHGGSGATARELAARIARGSRPFSQWRSDLARLIEGDRDYREAATREEDLWRVVEDGSAPEDARAAAALVLRKNEDAAPRLRIAAETVASPKLRVALETAANPEAEEKAIDDALASFVDDAQKQRERA